LLDPIRLLEFSLATRDDEVWYPGVIIEDEPIRVVAGGKRDCFPVSVQASLEILHFVSKGKVTKGVLFLLPSNGGGEALGNVEHGNWVVSVEVHYSVGSVRRDGSWRSHGGLYSGRRANGRLNQSVDGNGRHGSESIGVMIGAGIVLAEVGMGEGMVRWLIVDPEEKELLGLKVRLKFKGDLSKGNSISGDGLWFGCDGLRESVHLTLVVILRVFIVERGLL
jgi:hypothetical protein